mmetsp:Transcript_59056/g.159102  ORF Transcript_59056/g.159102 Transcript_59056/m.159102 type:complete len:242 (-) Transcript_59056:511-1236(-)
MVSPMHSIGIEPSLGPQRAVLLPRVRLRSSSPRTWMEKPSCASRELQVRSQPEPRAAGARAEPSSDSTERLSMREGKARTDCRACTHSFSNSATTKAFQASLESCLFKSVRWARSAMESPAQVTPPKAAEPMPSPTPTGGKWKAHTAEAMPRPAEAVFPTFTPNHWPVNLASNSCKPCIVLRCTARRACRAADTRFVVQMQYTFGFPRPTAMGAAPSAASRVGHRASGGGLDATSSQCSQG